LSKLQTVSIPMSYFYLKFTSNLIVILFPIIVNIGDGRETIIKTWFIRNYAIFLTEQILREHGEPSYANTVRRFSKIDSVFGINYF